MIDQLRIGDVYSFDNFFASVKERKIGEPKKKVIKEEVPFSNEIYDFTKINGETYWKERTLEYILELDANTPEEVEDLKTELKKWLMNVHEEELFDPFIKGYHFKATFDDIDFDDSEFEKTTATVTFSAYPFKISDNSKKFLIALPGGADVTAYIVNNSAHRVTPMFNCNIPITFEMHGNSYSLNAGETTDDSFSIEPGQTEITIQSTETAGNLTISFFEEVF